MKITAVEKSNNVSADIKITNNKGRLSTEDIQKLIKQAEKWKDQDQKIKQKIEAKNHLEGTCANLKHQTNDNNSLSEDQKKHIISKV